jgi:hypothetical protein
VKKQLLSRDGYDVKNKSFNNYNFFMDLNEPLKFDENYKDDVEEGVLDLKFLVCDVHDKKRKLDIAAEVIFYKACCEGCVSHVIKRILELTGSKLMSILLYFI